MKKLNKKGFTLVELLAVIVILALLMVVATSTIGSSLTKSKVSAMGTEAQKLYRKTVEDLTTRNTGDGTEGFTYGTLSGSTLTLKDSSYNMIATIVTDSTTQDESMGDFCIDDGTNYRLGTITNGAISWKANYTSAYKSGTCATVNGPQAQTES